ncbi:MAG: ComF family protein [Bacteroidales bacterium]|nr:ComF family protein [Bacteroidales bacterium]
MSPLSAIFNVIFPSSCACCGRLLVYGERQVCIHCLTDLSQTLYSQHTDNPVERMLTGRIPFAAATATFHFARGNTVQHAVHAMKFHGNTELCLLMGRRMGMDIMASSRFDGVDCLVPVPLHWRRRISRGYNQSELLCQGMAEVMHKPVVTTAISRHRYTQKQSQSSARSRSGNVEKAFRLRKASLIEGKHVLLVDDVLTTGATLTACADALVGVDGLQISIATFSSVV